VIDFNQQIHDNNKMKITLISIYPDLRSFGIRIISACLKQAGHDVDLIFLLKDFTEKFAEKTMNDLVKLTKGSDLVGISLMSNFFDNAIQITQKLRESYNFPILWGGTHPTIRPEECLDYADMVAIGESEETLIELSRKMQNKQYYYDTKGMGFNNKGKIIVNKLRELPGNAKAEIKSLDQIPFQDYDYKSHFILNGEDIVKMDTEIFKKHWDRVYMTQPTRGCPFACTFCVNNAYLAMHPHQKPIRKRSVDNIIVELKKVKDQIPFIRCIMFDDDAFFLMSLDEISDFSKKYKEHIRIPLFITGATPSTLTKEKLSLLVDAGLFRMRMGIQTAGTSTKKLYKRPHTNQQVENAVRMIHSHKELSGQYDIILDSPWDTDEDKIETLMFLSKLPTPFRLTLFSLVFFPGTELYSKAKKEGIIKDDLNDVYRKHYHGCKNTYLNRLFFLLSKYAFIGVGIAPKIMSFLTHKKTRQLQLYRPLIVILKIFYPFFKIKYLVHAKGLRGTLYRLKTTQTPKIARLIKKLELS
jgi:radical SAM superfamily enzyme YgiQ (UPF0313 family)